MMKRWMFLVLCGLCLSATMVQAEAVNELDDVVVVATRIETPVSQIGSAVTVIGRDTIERLQQPSVLDLLRTVPGVDVVRSGGLGQKTSVFMRGANSEHTLVLIDGIEANDPNDPSRAFDFAHLPTENIERIEVLRGPQSTLYGSNALGGVINIVTRKGKGEAQLELLAEAGSFNTQRYQGGVYGGSERINYSLQASYLDSDGITAGSRDTGNIEHDGYEKTAISARVGVAAAENTDVDLIVRYNESDTDIDRWAGPLADDSNYLFNSEQLFSRAQVKVELFEQRWEQILGVSYTQHNRGTHNALDPANPFDTERSSYDGTLTKVDWQHNLRLDKVQTLTVGVEHEQETGKSSYDSNGMWGPYNTEFKKKSIETFGGYLQDQLQISEQFFATVGVRVDDHENFGSETTWRATAAYHLKATDTRFKASYGTGFKAPSLLQLYDVAFGGNEDLDPESSQGWDVGIEQPFAQGKVSVGLSYFENDFDDLITNRFNTTTFKYEYINLGEAEISGVEATLFIAPFDNLSVQCSYTYTDAEDKNSHEQLVRRARNRLAVDLYYQLLSNLDLSATYLYVGPREDIFFDMSDYSSGRIDLSSYSVVNVAVGYDVNDTVHLFGRVDNLFDKDYNETWGYESPGIAAYAGVKLRL
ncbi:MAG: TonB-dependent receptor [Desulfuromonas sp.]|nr:TonB-dependent receptor [Desulfuromonas sp.]